MNPKFPYRTILAKKILGGCRLSVMMHHLDTLTSSKKKGDRNTSNTSHLNIIVYIHKLVQ